MYCTLHYLLRDICTVHYITSLGIHVYCALHYLLRDIRVQLYTTLPPKGYMYSILYIISLGIHVLYTTLHLFITVNSTCVNISSILTGNIALPFIDFGAV